MNRAQRANLDERIQRVYLTILAHADAGGLSAQCSWTDIMDYAGISKPDGARAAVGDLTDSGLLRLEPDTMRKPIFRILGKFADDILDAQAFQAKNQERVNGLRNSRTRAYAQTKAGRSGGIQDQVVIRNMEHLPASSAEKPNRWRFTARVPGFGSVSNCIYIDYTHKTPEVKGPSWRTGAGPGDWLYPVEFETDLYQRLFSAAFDAVEQEKLKTEQIKA